MILKRIGLIAIICTFAICEPLEATLECEPDWVKCCTFLGCMCCIDFGVGCAEPQICDPCASEWVFGQDSYEVAVLRDFRDNFLSQTPVGQEITRQYYMWSPAIVKAMEEDEEFREQVKKMVNGVLELITEEVE